MADGNVLNAMCAKGSEMYMRRLCLLILYFFFVDKVDITLSDLRESN